MLIAQAIEHPLLLNCILATAARHRVIIINTEQYPGAAREYDARSMFTRAISYQTCAVRLLRGRVAERNSLDRSTAGRIDENIVAGNGRATFTKPQELWQDDSMVLVLMFLIYYDAIDGGIGDGNWRNHLEIAKWVIEKREDRGLEMGARGGNWES